MNNTTAILSRQLALLQLEYEHERNEFKQLSQTQGVGRKVKRGDCWFPVGVGRSYFNSLNQLVVEITRTEDCEIEHNFEYGRQVMFFYKSGVDDITYFNFGATVSYAESHRMIIVMPSKECVSQLMIHDAVGVQLSFDETTFRLMINALKKVISAKDNRIAQLRDLFYNKGDVKKYKFATLSFPWLNSTQECAVNEVLMAQDVAVVHGPPGTGKTTTLVEAIYETLMRESQVMVCAQSNMAVDWISEQLMDRGVDVLRVGNPTRVNDKMLSQTYERRYEAHPDYPQLWALRKTMREMRSSKGKSENFHQKMDRLKNRAMDIELRIHNDLMGKARVIACTLAGSASKILEGVKFNTLFIDEAAQALEAACWIAIAKANRVIFAGDHQQLPPTVKCIDALKGGLEKTLMERIVENKPQVVTLLKVQYRMNEDIMRFSSNWFYNGNVDSAPEVKNRSILDLDIPITWIDTSDVEGEEEFVGDSYGRINRNEAKLTVEKLKEYFERVGKQRLIDEKIDVGIISPYRAQVQYLRRLLSKNSYFKPFRSLISVNTVDGFQGQERDIIVISMVRDNEKGEIGFLRDLRRMNVAITRARMKLIVMGNATTLCRHPFYKELYEYIEKINNKVYL